MFIETPFQALASRTFAARAKIIASNQGPRENIIKSETRGLGLTVCHSPAFVGDDPVILAGAVRTVVRNYGTAIRDLQLLIPNGHGHRY
jgi:hypothetical protein